MVLKNGRKLVLVPLRLNASALITDLEQKVFLMESDIITFR